MKPKHNTVPPSLVREGFYFEKGNSKGWLRQYVYYDRQYGKATSAASAHAIFRVWGAGPHAD